MTTPLETVHQAYGEFGKGNIPGVLNLLAEDVSWKDPGYPDIPYAGQRKGKTHVMDFFTGLARTVTFTRFEPQRFVCEGNVVVAQGIFTVKGNATGRTAETDWVMIWEVVDGKIRYYQAFIDTIKVASVLK